MLDRTLFLMILVSLVLPGSIFYKVDETGIARGRLEPKEGTIKVTSTVAGTVDKILVSEGDFIKAGETFARLDSTRLQSILQQTSETLEQREKYQDQLQRLNQQLEISLFDQQQQNQLEILEKKIQLERLRDSLEAKLNRYEAQKQDSTNIDQPKKIVSSNRGLENSYSSNVEQSQVKLLNWESDYQNNLIQSQSDIIQTRSQFDKELQAYRTLVNFSELAVLKIKKQIKNNENYSVSLQVGINLIRKQIKDLDIQLTARTLKAPITGTIFTLPISQAGYTVRAGTKVAEIAPQNAPLIIRSRLPKTIGIIPRQGLPVKIKLDAYPAKKYGFVEGEIEKISEISAERNYELEIELNQACIAVNEQCIPLLAGETSTVEIITRQRRAIELIFSPLLKLFKLF